MSRIRNNQTKQFVLCVAFLVFGVTYLLQPVLAADTVTWGVAEGDTYDYMCYSWDFNSNMTESYGSTYEILSIENDTIKGNFIKDQATMIDNDVICEVNMTNFMDWVPRMVVFFPLPLNESVIRANLQVLCTLYGYANYSVEFIEGAQMLSPDHDFESNTELNVTINENGVVARWETEPHLYKLKDNPVENFLASIDGFPSSVVVGLSMVASFSLIRRTQKKH